MAERRTRFKRLSIDADSLVERALDFVQRDEQSREQEMDARRQRYAKYRQWTDDYNNQPWEGAADIAVADLATISFRIQDTLENAVLSRRPVIEANAIRSSDKDREAQVNDTIDHQVFLENGYDWLSDAIESFVNDGHFTAFIPWVVEDRQVLEIMKVPPIPEDELPSMYFRQAIDATLGPDAAARLLPRGDPADAWDFSGPDQEDRPWSVAFYTVSGGGLEMHIKREKEIYNGPKIIVKDREDVLHPVYVSNLQPPGPSNPGGASHVILVDRPILDEISRLQRSGFYDRITAADVKRLADHSGTIEPSREEEQRAIIEGAHEQPDNTEGQHKRVTRLMVFDIIDIDGDGIAEDVVYWILKEDKKLLRVKRLSELYPSTRPYRPFAESSLIPVKGRRTGMGILEVAEGLHDIRKQLLDQTVDAGTLANSPFFFYRPSSSLKPEVLRLWPGEGYPLSDPRNDVSFPAMSIQGPTLALNMLTMLEAQEERLTMIGDLQLGRVPKGRASALRTTTGMSLVQGQGEARPERMLRRFFRGLSQIWQRIHDLNQEFLPPEKEIRIAPASTPSAEAYRNIKPSDVSGDYTFEFQANVFNTSRQAMQESLQQLASLYLSPIAIQAQVVDPNGIYMLLRDLGNAWGQDSSKYIHPPGGLPPILWEEALLMALDLQQPFGTPAEGAPEHMRKAQLFLQSAQAQVLDEAQKAMILAWLQQVVQGSQQQQQLVDAAAQTGGQQPGQAAASGPAPSTTPPPVQPNELMDETLPSSGGGASGVA